MINVTPVTTTNADLILLVGCPIAAALGTVVSAILSDRKLGAWHAEVRFFLGRLFVGMVLGAVIALYLFGMIKEQTTDIARVIALCILAGYQAPNLWFSQERLIKQLIEKEVEKHSSKP